MIERSQVATWQKAMEDFIINDIRKAVTADNLEVGLIILCLIGVDCLGGYLSGTKAVKDTFVKFFQTYFPQEYHPYAKTIYENLRSPLVHDYVTEPGKDVQFIMCRDENEPHLVWYEPNRILWFNRKRFALDFLQAWQYYLADVQTHEALFERVKQRINIRGFLSVVPSKS